MLELLKFPQCHTPSAHTTCYYKLSTLTVKEARCGHEPPDRNSMAPAVTTKVQLLPITAMQKAEFLLGFYVPKLYWLCEPP